MYFLLLTCSYVDYFRCVNSKGEEFEPCKQFYSAFHSLCPNEWVCILCDELTISSRSGMSSVRAARSLLSWTPNFLYLFDCSPDSSLTSQVDHPSDCMIFLQCAYPCI